MDQNSIFEQAAQISKNYHYDILVKQVGELKQIIRDLIEAADLNDLVFTDDEDTLNFKTILNKAKIAAL